MRKVAFLTGSFVLALGFVGSQGLLQAQSSYRTVVRPPAPSTPVIQSPSSAKITSDGPLSSMELQIELAWLADPVTFPFDLKARTREGKLQVLGNVANQAARDRALLLAGQFATVQVLDKMKIQGKLATKSETGTASDLQIAVTEAINREIGSGSGRLEIKAHTSGQVSIAGSVASLEKKLAVSKCLQGVNGCACVINLVDVTETSPKTTVTQKDPPRSLQDRLTSLFTGSSTKNETASDVKIASTWKQNGTSKKPEVKAQGVDQPASIAVISSNPPVLDNRPIPTISPIKTVAFKDESSAVPEKTPPTNPAPAKEKNQNNPIEPNTEELELEPVPQKSKQPDAATAHLQHEIEKICGKSAHNIQVDIKPDKSVGISLECKNKSDAERLSKQILHLKSLAPYEVGLDINFEP